MPVGRKPIKDDVDHRRGPWIIPHTELAQRQQAPVRTLPLLVWAMPLPAVSEEGLNGPTPPSGCIRPRRR
jgi:hypothetical protein